MRVRHSQLCAAQSLPTVNSARSGHHGAIATECPYPSSSSSSAQGGLINIAALRCRTPTVLGSLRACGAKRSRVANIAITRVVFSQLPITVGSGLDGLAAVDASERASRVACTNDTNSGVSLGTKCCGSLLPTNSSKGLLGLAKNSGCGQLR